MECLSTPTGTTIVLFFRSDMKQNKFTEKEEVPKKKGQEQNPTPAISKHPANSATLARPESTHYF